MSWICLNNIYVKKENILGVECFASAIRVMKNDRREVVMREEISKYSGFHMRDIDLGVRVHLNIIEALDTCSENKAEEVYGERALAVLKELGIDGNASMAYVADVGATLLEKGVVQL